MNILYQYIIKYLPFELCKIVKSYSNFYPNEYIKYCLDSKCNDCENIINHPLIFDGVLDINVHMYNNKCLIVILFYKHLYRQGFGANVIVLDQDLKYLYPLCVKDPSNNAITIDSKNRIYVANNCHLHVYKWNHKRRSIQLIQKINIGKYIENITLDKFNNIYVFANLYYEVISGNIDDYYSDLKDQGNRTYIFNSNLKLISNSLTQFGNASTIKIDEKGTMYVVQRQNDKTIFRFRSSLTTMPNILIDIENNNADFNHQCKIITKDDYIDRTITYIIPCLENNCIITEETIDYLDDSTFLFSTDSFIVCYSLDEIDVNGKNLIKWKIKMEDSCNIVSLSFSICHRFLYVLTESNLFIYSC